VAIRLPAEGGGGKEKRKVADNTDLGKRGTLLTKQRAPVW